jgi:hypothetical protein
MTKREKESIIVLSKYLAICKDDTKKFSTIRNYLHHRISKIFEMRMIENIIVSKS